MELGIGGICLRLLCAMAVGMIIGTEREYTNRPAGLRTHILVALGACVVTITGQMIFIFITLTILEFLQHKLIGNHDPVKDYAMETADLATGLNALNTHAQKQTAAIQNIQVQRLEGSYRVTFRAEIGGARSKIRQQHFFAALAQDPAITLLQTLDADPVMQ